MAITRRLRFEILRRDGFACHYCHRADVDLTVDHVVPEALGGADTPDNLVAACQACNAGKAATMPDDPLVAAVDEAALKWAAAMKRAGELQRAQDINRELFIDAFDRGWREWAYVPDEPPMRSPTWRQAVDNWHDAGLEIEALLAIIDDVMPRRIPNGRIWRYYCGAVRNYIEQRAEIASGLLEDER